MLFYSVLTTNKLLTVTIFIKITKNLLTNTYFYCNVKIGRNNIHERINAMKKFLTVSIAAFSATVLTFSALEFQTGLNTPSNTIVTAASDSSDWGAMNIGGGGFVSGIVTGKKTMYARTDVGGMYKYNYDSKKWEQLMGFISEEDKGFLSVDAMCIDPNDDNTAYFLCGCAYFSSERTAVFKTSDGGKTFTEYDVTDLIKVHGNGYGRQCGEAIAVDPDNSDIIYCGGDTDGLIVSKDGGKTWSYDDAFQKLGLFTNEIKWPTWGNVVEKTTVGMDYVNCNGISTIAINKGKVYVGISDNTIGANVYVSDVGKGNWKPLSADLPTKAFPSRINLDADGNLLMAYVGGLQFAATGGGLYKYDVASGKVTNISPTENSYGSCVSLPDNSNELIAATCGVWSSQLWDKDAWDNDTVAWGDQFYRSHDGGKTWESVTPGVTTTWQGPLAADYLQDGGHEWIRNKAIHWCGSLVLDPRDSDRILMTSGNGVFACDNIWDEIPVYYFHPDGIEEVVPLDLVSVPGGYVYSAIGDYDGFIHKSVDESIQYSPSLGSTSCIAYCPADPKVMFRGSMNEAKGCYTTDGGETWKMITTSSSNAKAAITKLGEGKYRIICGMSYSDDFGSTWKQINGISVSGDLCYQVDSEKPNYVYAAGNDNNPYDDSVKPHNYLFVSDDYGATFTKKTICEYDKAEQYSRIAMITGSSGSVLCPAGYYGLYLTKDYGESFNKLEGVTSCFAVGIGAAKDKNSPMTIYMWGTCGSDKNTGAYASTDLGKTWVKVNDDEHQYGGTGNGKFIIGDMNEFGTYYMSTVGMGIIYHKNAFSTSVSPSQGETPTTTVTKETKQSETKASTSASSAASSSGSEKIVYGDLNDDGTADLTDLTLLSIALMEHSKFDEKHGIAADVDGNGEIDIADLALFKQYVCKDNVYLGPRKK